MSLESTTTPLKIRVTPDYERMSRVAAGIIESELRKNPKLLLCASAGGTPSRTYELLSAHRRAPQFQHLRVLQIDEWGGIPSSHPATCKSDLMEKLIKPLGLPSRSFFSLKSDAADPGREARRLSSWLCANGPIDLCILGLGVNGHVAMNEPTDSLIPHAHVAALAKSSLNHDMLKNLPQKPTYGLTVGMRDILNSRKILLLVSGRKKRATFRKLFTPRVTTALPASFLWLHSDVSIICDRGAAGDGWPTK